MCYADNYSYCSIEGEDCEQCEDGFGLNQIKAPSSVLTHSLSVFIYAGHTFNIAGE